METDINDINVGGLVLCKKLVTRRSYIFRWWREDFIYQSSWISKFLRWIKEKLLFISQWTPVGNDEWNCLMSNNRKAMKIKLMRDMLIENEIDHIKYSDDEVIEIYGDLAGTIRILADNYMIAGDFDERD